MTIQEAHSNSRLYPLAGKVALVTGASRGLGRAIALRLGHDGAAVVVSYLTNAELAEEVVQTIEENGSQAIAIQANLHDIASIRHLFQRTIKTFHKLDILVNNAAPRSTLKTTANLSLEEYNDMFDNTRGFFLPYKRQHGG